ncbi:MAG: hypothetical protein ABUS79_01570 [Pseudomonadota bacterium]
MPFPRYLLPLLFVAVTAASGGAARAQAARGSAVGASALATERQKLAAELSRVNGEIDALKREKRGLRDDYRLRARMADAEALARRLTELDGLLGTKGPATAMAADAPWPAAPQVRPYDDRGDLEAKADILSDQARRLTLQADALDARVSGVRGRQELRRRANQLERDPFSPLEQAKRRIGTTTSVGGGIKDATSTGVGSIPRVGETPGPSSIPNMPSTPSMPSQPASGSGAGAQPGPVATPGNGFTATPTTATDQATRSTTIGAAAAPSASPLGGLPAGDNPGSLASQFRGILDATTLAEIRRLEVPGSSAGSLQAMERALSALRARAAALASDAAALRKKAKAGQ